MSALNRLSYFILAFAMLVLISPAQAQLTSNRFKNAVFSGTMNSNLPSVQTQNAATAIYFAKTSTISFTSTMFCGDGDVAAFKASHKDITFYSQDKATPGKLVLGYWAVPGSQTKISEVTPPTQAQWFAIGSADLTNDGAQITNLLRANTAAADSAYTLLNNSLTTLTSISDNATWIKTKPDYSIYVAAMICPSFETTDGTKLDSNVENGETNGAISEQIMQQVINGSLTPGSSAAGYITAKWNSVVTSASQIDKFYANNLRTIGVETLKASSVIGMTINLGKGTDGTKVAVDSASLSAVQGLANDTINYVKDESGSLDSQYGALSYYLQQLAAGNTCTLTPLGNHNFSTVKQYSFEPFPIHSTCGMATNLAISWKSVDSALIILRANCVRNPKTGVIINQVACDGARLAMARTVTVAVAAPLVMHAAADELEKRIVAKSSKINKASCLPVANLGSLNDIMKVAGSVHIPIISTGTSALQFKDPGAMVHPEPNFALTEYLLYQGTDGDRRAIFNPAYSDSPKDDAKAGSALKLTLGVKKGYTFSSPGVNVQFHARAIGCPGPAFCLAPPPTKLNRPGDPI